MTQTPVYGPNGLTGTGLTVTVAEIIYSIDSGAIDTALRVVFDAVVDRKKILQAEDNLPPQITRQEVEAGMTWASPQQDQVLAASNGQTSWQGNSPIPAATLTIDTPAAPKQVRRKRAPEQRPDPNVQPFNGTIQPMTRQQQQGADANVMIPLYGYVYLKSDIIGRYVHIDFPGHPGLTFKITGVGPKTLKALVVHEPTPGTRLQGKDVWKAWNTNTPMFLPHSAISTWLGRPIDPQNY